jgi:phosphate-selective porin OprO and OprP
VVLLVASGFTAEVEADETSDTINSLREQIQQLDQKLKILERKGELQREATESKAKETPRISIGEDGFSMSSPNGDFAVRIGGQLQVDSRTYLANGDLIGNDGFLLRRARPILSGTVYRDFDFMFMPDFGLNQVQIFDAWVNYRYMPELQLRAGKFKSPVGLEQLQSDVNLAFNERALVSDLVPNRDVGLDLHGDLWGGILSYDAAYLNGVGDARNSSNVNVQDDQTFAGRIFALPFKTSKLDSLQGVGIGVGGSYGDSFNANGLPATTGGTLPGYITRGQQQFFAYNPAGGAVVAADGTHWRISPQGYYYWGPLSLMGEYAISNQKVRRSSAVPLTVATLQHTAWDVTAGWVLTGENATFNGVTPAHPFNPLAGQWGALQVVAGYSELNIDPDTFPLYANPATSARSAKEWAVGLNWWLNRDVRILASYSRTTFEGGGGAGTTAPAIVTRQPEDVFFTRIQLAF